MTPRRASAPAAASDRAVGLIRVSKERDGMVSPDIQQAAIESYAATRGYQITGWLEGLDESGSRARSAWWQKLDEGVRRVEDGEADVLLVWKFSRAARHRLRWAVALDRVESAGGRLESATEQVDTTTSTGRFTRGMLAELQAFEAERIGEVWKDVHRRRVESGRPATGKPKWGYVYDLEAQLHRPDPVTGPVLADLYRRYVAGESVYQLVRWLNARGHVTLTGGPWSERSLRRVMDSGFAAGKFMSGGVLRDGVHEALIGEDLWLAYEDARVARRARPSRVERSPYLLSGLVRCGRCGGSMVAGQFGHARSPKYRCKAGKEQGPTVCVGGYVMASLVEGAVLEWLRGQAEDVETAAEAALAAETIRQRGVDEVERLRRQLSGVQQQLERLVLAQASQPEVPDAVWAQTRVKLGEQYRSLESALESAGREVRAGVGDPQVVASGLLGVWETSPVEHRRQLLRSLVGEVRVWSGRPAARVVVVPAWGDIGVVPR